MIDIRRYRDRLIVAVAVAIAFHEVLLGLLHGPAPSSDTESTGVTTKIVLQVRPTPSPRPTPRPTPTPRATPQPTPQPHHTPPPRTTPAPVKQVAGRAKGAPARHRGGGAHRAVPRIATTGSYAAPNAAGVGTSPSAGNGSAVQPGTGGGQNGPGNGDQGNGNGAVNADTPCGVVDFKPYAAPRYSSGTASEPVEATVTFPDGHRETARFPYPWIYPNGEQTDPWSDTNLKNPDFITTLRFPPAGSDPATYPPLIQYILKHTDSGGYTNLQPCPQSRG